MFKILGIDDAINTCDCCGKSNLKSTVIVENDDGEVLHYGSICATRHTKYTSKEIKSQLKEVKKQEAIAYAQRKQDACAELRKSPEYRALMDKQKEAHNMRMCGLPFRDFCIVEQRAYDVFVRQLKEKFNLENSEFLF